ncbi:hypothetical protein Efla_000226 [Eimeria flavescens]
MGNSPSHAPLPLDGYTAVRASIEARFSRVQAKGEGLGVSPRCHTAAQQGVSKAEMTRDRQQRRTHEEARASSDSTCRELRAAGSLPPSLSVAETTDTNSEGAPDEFEAAAAAEQMLGGLSQSFTRVKAPQVRAQSPLPFPSLATCSATVSRATGSRQRLQQSSSLPSKSAAAPPAVAASPRSSSRPQRLTDELLLGGRQQMQQRQASRRGEAVNKTVDAYVKEADIFCPLSPNSALSVMTPTAVTGCGGPSFNPQGGPPGAQGAPPAAAAKREQLYYGPACNHSPFLEGRALQALLPFLFGPSLGACMGVCVHWFICISDGLAEMCSPLSRDFKAAYGKYLLPLNATFKVQPLQTADGSGARVDWVIAAEVLPAASNKVLSLGYCFGYRPQPSVDSRVPSESAVKEGPLSSMSSRLTDSGISSRRSTLRGRQEEEPPSPSVICSPDKGGSLGAQGRRELPTFSVAVAPAGSRRRLWLHRDLCRFHGDETGQAVLTHLGPVCVGDFVEVPIVLLNGIGLADLPSVKWLPLHCLPRGPRVLAGLKAFEALSLGVYEACGLEIQYNEWFDGDQYRHLTTERLKRPECMQPELQHVSTSYTGIDVLVRRTVYRAARVEKQRVDFITTNMLSIPHFLENTTAAAGSVGARALQAWGLQCEVVPASKAIVFPLTRKGLQHDRSTCLQLREGDLLEAYMTVGGANF